MDLKTWNRCLCDHFFSHEKEGSRVYFSVTEELLKELAGDDALADLIMAVKGPECHIGYARTVCSSARILSQHWIKNGRAGPPPFLPYLALFVIAAGRESPEGHPGFHKKLHELLGEEPQNTPVPGFYNMWELWELLADWSKSDVGGKLGSFECKIEAGGRTHVSIPLSQTVLTPAERARLPELFAAADLDPNNPPSDQELADIVRKLGAKCGLHSRTLKALGGSGETSEEFKALLVESLLDELQEWQPYDEDLTRESTVEHGAHLLINLHVDRFSAYLMTADSPREKSALPTKAAIIHCACPPSAGHPNCSNCPMPRCLPLNGLTGQHLPRPED